MRSHATNYHDSLPDVEGAMNTTTMTSYRTRMFNWSQLKQRFAEWRWRYHSRQELESLSDATLRDIGITRCDVHRELRKPFWMT